MIFFLTPHLQDLGSIFFFSFRLISFVGLRTRQDATNSFFARPHFCSREFYRQVVIRLVTAFPTAKTSPMDSFASPLALTQGFAHEI